VTAGGRADGRAGGVRITTASVYVSLCAFFIKDACSRESEDYPVFIDILLFLVGEGEISIDFSNLD